VTVPLRVFTIDNPATLVFFDTNFRSLGPGEPLARASNESGVDKNGEKYADFRPVNHISETIENRHTVTIIDFDY